MSWGGLGIMDGDAPADNLADLLDKMGASLATAHALDKHREVLHAFCLEQLQHDEPTTAQVWATLVLAAGATATDKDKELMLVACASDQTSGFDEPEVRAHIMRRLRNAVISHQAGTPSDVDDLLYCQANAGRKMLVAWLSEHPTPPRPNFLNGRTIPTL